MVQQINSLSLQTCAAKQNVSQKQQKKDTKDTFGSLINSAAATPAKTQVSDASKNKTAKAEKENSGGNGSASTKCPESGTNNTAAAETASVNAAFPSQQVQQTVNPQKAGNSIQQSTGSVSAVSAANSSANEPNGTTVIVENIQVSHSAAAAEKNIGQSSKASIDSALQSQKVQNSDTPQIDNINGIAVKPSANANEAANVSQQSIKAAQNTDANIKSVKIADTNKANTAPNKTENKNDSHSIGNDIQHIKTNTGSKAQDKSDMGMSSTEGGKSSFESDGTKSAEGNQLKDSSLFANVALRHNANIYTDGKVVVKISSNPSKAVLPASRQITDSITYNLKNGKQEFNMNLYPQSLGKVAVKMTSESGMLTVVIAASNPKTQSLLASNSSDIKSILQSSTGNNVQVINRRQQDSSAAYSGNQQSGSGGYSANQNQQQQQSSENRRTQAIWYANHEANFSTGDFLSMIQHTAADAI